MIAKHSITITPTTFDLLLAYIRFFIYDRQEKLERYRQRKQEVKSTEVRPGADETVAALQTEIAQAKALAGAIEPAKAEFVRIYELNFELLAEVFRKTRIELELEEIERMHSLKVALKHANEMLKGINPMFSLTTVQKICTKT